MSCTVKIENLDLVISGNRILKNINLKATHGDFITILGKNGAGKTSVLKVIMGIYKASGIVKICDEVLEKSNLLFLRKKIAYLPQNFVIDKYFPILVKDILQLPLNEKLSKNKKAKEIIEEFGIFSLLEYPFGILSGGEKQKVMLAMTLLKEPIILLLDEPNLNLDYLAYKNFLEMVEKIYHEKKLTILFITHLINHIPDASKKVIVMKNGQIIFSGAKSEIFKMENFLEFIYD
jgi:ABC-type Mn2+/Zn2+ transport system ATPase subunit